MPVPDLARAAVVGVALGASFNPLASVIGASVAAAAYARRGAFALWVAVLAVAWVAGDGVGLLGGAAARAGAASGGVAVAVSVTAAVASFLLGYALPAWVGAKVGRRVTHGTGWLSAVVVAATVSVALSTVGGGGGELLAGVL